MAGRRLRRGRVQRSPHLPPLLLAQPGPQHLRRPTRRHPQMLPVIDRAPPHLPRGPPAPHQQRRPLRVRPPAPVTPVPLHPYHLPPTQEPWPTLVAPPLAGLGL